MIGNTEQNLRSSIEGETLEHRELYPQYAEVAREEGFQVVARVFESIAVAEGYHAERFGVLLKRLVGGRMFEREEEVTWRCRKCGYLHRGREAPMACIACAHPRSYFDVLGEDP